MAVLPLQKETQVSTVIFDVEMSEMKGRVLEEPVSEKHPA